MVVGLLVDLLVSRWLVDGGLVEHLLVGRCSVYWWTSGALVGGSVVGGQWVGGGPIDGSLVGCQ